jgi:hypothetical protein
MFAPRRATIGDLVDTPFRHERAKLWASAELGSSVSVIGSRTQQIVHRTGFLVRGPWSDQSHPVDDTYFARYLLTKGPTCG